MSFQPSMIDKKLGWSGSPPPKCTLMVPSGLRSAVTPLRELTPDTSCGRSDGRLWQTKISDDTHDGEPAPDELVSVSFVCQRCDTVGHALSSSVGCGVVSG